MPTVYEEGTLRFEFDESWTVLEYDDTLECKRVQECTEAKRVDFLGRVQSRDPQPILYLMEVKDFRGHRIENKPRIQQGTLALEVIQEVRDTVAGVIAAARTSSDNRSWTSMAQLLSARESQVKIVLWRERDQPRGAATDLRQRYRRMRRSTELGVLAESLKSRSRWLTPRAFVVDQHIGLEGVAITNLPGAGRA